MQLKVSTVSLKHTENIKDSIYSGKMKMKMFFVVKILIIENAFEFFSNPETDRSEYIAMKCMFTACIYYIEAFHSHHRQPITINKGC